MTLKNSFWVNLKENNKRRIWIWIVSSLFWFFYYPVAMALLMSRKHNHNILDGLTGKLAADRLEHAALDWLSPLSGVSVLVCIMAVVCAVQGFSYLYSKKKVDLYHSMPIKKSRRFAVIFINGILIYAVPYLVNLLLALVVAGISGGMSAYNFKMAMITAVINFILYMGAYGLTLIAVMLTGNLVITMFATVIFFFYEVCFRYIIKQAQSSFFDYYTYNSENAVPLISPMGQWYVLQKIMKDGTGLGGAIAEQPMAFILLLLMAALFPVIAYICYKKRPSEAAGKPMAFGKTKFAVKFLLVVPFSATVGWMVRDVTGAKNFTVLVILGMATAVALGSCIMEVIYEMDIRAAFKHKSQMLISGVTVAVIYSIFCFDLFGVDAWIPDEDKLDNAVVMILNDSFSRSYVNKNLEYVSTTEHFLAGKGITDKEAIIELSEKKLDVENLEGNLKVLWCRVAYRMKNGRIVWREFPVDVQEKEVLNRIVGSEEYKETVCQLYDDTLFDKMKTQIKEIAFDSGYRVESLPPEDIEIIRQLYMKDMNNGNYTTYTDEFICGVLNISTESRLGEYGPKFALAYDIYPSYTNTIQYLKEKGIYKENPLDASKIASITVTNYHNEMRQEQEAELGIYGEVTADYVYDTDTSITKTFVDETQIKELTDAMYPESFKQNWKAADAISGNYYATIQYKDGTIGSSTYRGERSAYLITDRIPSWLEKETAYK